MMHALSGEEEKGGSSEGVADSSSIINGEQPSATTSTSSVADLRCALAAQGLDSRGTKKTIKRRLQKQRAKQQRGTAVKAVVQEEERDWRPKHDTYLVLDVEATCEGSKNGSFDYPNEIIEMPVVLLQWTEGFERLEVKDTFHTYVRPTWRPKLTTFCRQLTGISQAQVDTAPEFLEVCEHLSSFLRTHGLLVEEEDPRLRKGVVWATHGPYDLLHFVVKQAFISKMRGGPPRFLRGPLLDIRKAVPKVVDFVKEGQSRNYERIDEEGHGKEASDPLVQSMDRLTIVEDAKITHKEEPSRLSWVTSSIGQIASSLGSFLGSPEATPTEESSQNGVTPDAEVTLDKQITVQESLAGGKETASLPDVTVVETKYAKKKREWRDRTIEGLLAQLSLGPFEGRQHCGLDDTRNVARIVCALAQIVVDNQKGCDETSTKKEVAIIALNPNTSCSKAGERKWEWMGSKLGKVIWAAQDGASEVDAEGTEVAEEINV